MRPWLVKVNHNNGKFQFITYCALIDVERVVMAECVKKSICYNDDVGYNAEPLNPRQTIEIK